MRSQAWQRTWLLVAAVCALGFAVLAVVVNGQGSVWFDADVIAAVRGLGIPPQTWRAFTEAGGAVLTVVGVGLVLWLVWHRRIQLAVIVGLALLAGTFATEFVKLAFERPRPPGEALAPWSGYSFPSGHTLNSTVTYGLVALVAWRTALPPVARRSLVAALAVLVAMIGLSRVALGVHYPSDVLAGWLGGLAIVSVVAAVPAVWFFATARGVPSSVIPVDASSVAGMDGPGVPSSVIPVDASSTGVGPAASASAARAAPVAGTGPVAGPGPAAGAAPAVGSED